MARKMKMMKKGKTQKGVKNLKQLPAKQEEGYTPKGAMRGGGSTTEPGGKAMAAMAPLFPRKNGGGSKAKRAARERRLEGKAV